MKMKNDKKHKTMRTKGLIRKAAAVFAMAVLSLSCPIVSLADSTGTVTVESAKIRANTDTSSEVVGSAVRGAKLTVREEVTDASGTLWYKVDVDANTTGYVRADLVEKEGGSDSGSEQSASASASGTETDGGSQSASGASAQPETPMEAQYATVSVEAAKIRSAPSTNDSVVERLEKGAQMIVNGKSNGSSDGKEWYYVTLTGADGTQKTGFVRNDLVTLGDMVPVPEEQPAPEEQPTPEPQETVSQDYEVVFKDGEWYLLDNLQGYEQKLQPLLDAGQQQSDTADADAKSLVRQRIVIVALAVLAVILIVVVVIMAVKLRDAYYEDYEDDEEDEDDEDDEGDEEDEEDETPVRRRRRVEEGPAARAGERPVRAARDGEQTARRGVRETEGRREPSGESRPKPAPKRKPKNFLVDDDEFEFEFLNMDDKDL